jgi:hypothetical protein
VGPPLFLILQGPSTLQFQMANVDPDPIASMEGQRPRRNAGMPLKFNEYLVGVPSNAVAGGHVHFEAELEVEVEDPNAWHDEVRCLGTPDEWVALVRVAWSVESGDDPNHLKDNDAIYPFTYIPDPVIAK